MTYENVKTLQDLLDKMMETVEIVRIGDILEAKDTAYPKNKNRNIIIEEKEITPPLFCDKSWKNTFLREESVLCKIYKDLNRGDFLKVVDINKNKILVENISVKEGYSKPFYINKEDIAMKKFLLVKRFSKDMKESLEKIN